MSAPADPVTAEAGYYEAIVSDYLGLRRAGAGLTDAALLTAALRLLMLRTAEATASL